MLSVSGDTNISGEYLVSGQPWALKLEALEDAGQYSGFIDGSNINVSYNYTNRTITLTGDLKYYWRGTLHELTSPWTSDAHTATQGAWYLYSNDGANFVWSNTVWDFKDIMVAAIRYGASASQSFAIRETHNLMDVESHKELHQVIGTYHVSGGQLTAGTYVENTYTDAAVTPGFDAAVIKDEDLQSSVSGWTEGTYTTIYVSGATVVTDVTSSYPFIAGGANQYIEINNPSTGAMTAGIGSRYYNIYQILLPAASDSDSQKYRMLMLQPQAEFTSLAAAKTEAIAGLSLGSLASLSNEFVVYARMTYFTLSGETNYGKCAIATGGVSYVTGTRVSQVSIDGVVANNHSALSNLTWADSAHIGTIDRIAGFDASGNATYVGVESNTGIGLANDELYTIYNTTLSSALTVPNDVGGIVAGTSVATLSGKTVVELFNDLLFPTVQPTYTIPTITLTGVTTQTLEVGVTFATNISAYGVKNDAGAYTQLRILRDGSPLLTDTTLSQTSATAIPDQFGYSDPNNPNYTYTIDPNPLAESYVIPLGTTLYKGDGNYSSGLAKNDNKGNADVRTPLVRSVDAPQNPSNNFETSTYTITGLYPYFYGVSATLPTALTIAAAISGGTATKVLTDASGTLTIPYNTSGNYIWFAYQASNTTKTKWWVSDLDSAAIDGSFITTAVTQNVNSPEAYWSGINFKMHWSVYSTIQNTIQFRNS